MNNTINNNITFTGRYNFIRNSRNFCQSRAASILSTDISEIKSLTGRVTKRKMNLFNRLVDNYNHYNFSRAAIDREDPKLVLEIFKRIKNPSEMHRFIIDKFGDSFADMSRVFSITGNSKKRMGFVKRVYKEVLNNDQNANRNIILELLESPHSKEYIKNFDKYKSYLILNRDNPDVVKILDEKCGTPSYYYGDYDKKLRGIRIKQTYHFPETRILNAENYLSYYSPENDKLMQKIRAYFTLSPQMFQNGNDLDIRKMLRTTTRQNISLRLAIIDAFKSKVHTSPSDEKNVHITELQKLFYIIDKDKNAKKFVLNSLEDLENSNLTLKSLNEILENLPTKKLNIFRKNVFRIISQTKSTERIKTIFEEIENPVFESEGTVAYRKSRERYYGKDRTRIFRHAKARIRNFFDIIRDRLTKDTGDDLTKIEKLKKGIIPNPEVSPAPEKISSPAVETEIVKPQINNLPEKIDVPTEKEIVQDTVLPATADEIKPVVKDRKTKKQDVIDNVLSFVTQKLGRKTFARQREAFAGNATGIRLNILPEIFASIADTRKVDRAVGKHRIRSSNNDVLELYLRINGNNKKLVLYMLKKRNVDNTRMFEVKDIIEAIDKAEAKIAADRKANPAYRARDARRYYNHLYEAKVQQYGKVTRQRKLNTKV